MLEACAAAAGSSPRAWGPRCVGCSWCRILRFIPTCVGTTGRSPGFLGERSVHPHVRGDHPVVIGAGHPKSGSSPRAWGPQPVDLTIGVFHRFIPTCVGTTGGERSGERRAPVHPHVRGDHACIAINRFCSAGSSPRAWGPLHDGFDLLDHGRFIPTCVGTTRTSRSCPRRCPVHPHVRGDHERRQHRQPCRIGSSPRAWGPRTGPGQDRLHPRFIPTCVGTTTTFTVSVRVIPVHPHVRGDHDIIVIYK